MRETPTRHGDLGAALWISAQSPLSQPHGKRPNTAKLHTVTPCHRCRDLFKYGVDGLLGVAPAKMQIRRSNALDQFFLYHWQPPGSTLALSCFSA
jgi:hypothetical protein